MSQLSVKMPLSERQRLLEVAFHEQGGSGSPDDVNLSRWVRDHLTELMDAYERGIPNGRVVVNQAFRDAARRDIEEKLRQLEK